MAESSPFCLECGASLLRPEDPCWLCNQPAPAGLSGPRLAIVLPDAPEAPRVGQGVRDPTLAGAAIGSLRWLHFRRMLALVAMILVGAIAVPLAGCIALFVVCLAALGAGGSPSPSQLSEQSFALMVLFVVICCPLMLLFVLFLRLKKHDESIRRLEGWPSR